jgi:hypothetical protein
MLQPLLLLKQTLEAPYDPGPLLLDGPSVKFTSVRQFTPAPSETNPAVALAVTVGTSASSKLGVGFHWSLSQGKFDVDYNYFESSDSHLKVCEDTTYKQLINFIRSDLRFLRPDEPRFELPDIEKQVLARNIDHERHRFWLVLCHSLIFG